MKPSDNIKKMFKEIKINTNTDTDKLVVDDAVKAISESRNKAPVYERPDMWRIIMQSKMTKLAVAAAIITVVAGISIFKTEPAWAISQTVEALENVETVVITGNDFWGDEAVPFKFSLQLPQSKQEQIQFRFESKKQIVVVQGTKAWVYWPDENVVKIYEDVIKSEDMMGDLAYWYKVSEYTPWISGKLLDSLKLLASNWNEDYVKDEKTGRDCVVVSCGYKEFSCSFWFVCDLETKLIVEGKQWRNINQQGSPVLHASSFKYNQKLDDEVFNFKTPETAKVIYQKDIENNEMIRKKAWNLFEQKKYSKALDKYKEIDDLFMAGICYHNSGEYTNAVESYKKIIRKKGEKAGAATYYYLGSAYMNIGDKQKAIEAFSNCLRFGKGIRNPEKFPIKDARESIEELNKTK